MWYSLNMDVVSLRPTLTIGATWSKWDKESSEERLSVILVPAENRQGPMYITKYGRKGRGSTRANFFKGGRNVLQGNGQAGILLGGELQFQGRIERKRN